MFYSRLIVEVTTGYLSIRGCCYARGFNKINVLYYVKGVMKYLMQNAMKYYVLCKCLVCLICKDPGQNCTLDAYPSTCRTIMIVTIWQLLQLSTLLKKYLPRPCASPLWCPSIWREEYTLWESSVLLVGPPPVKKFVPVTSSTSKTPRRGIIIGSLLALSMCTKTVLLLILMAPLLLLNWDSSHGGVLTIQPLLDVVQITAVVLLFLLQNEGVFVTIITGLKGVRTRIWFFL